MTLKTVFLTIIFVSGLSIGSGQWAIGLLVGCCTLYCLREGSREYHGGRS